jgi:pimeloyl-ACP methyl ester carboxylesterase
MEHSGLIHVRSYGDDGPYVVLLHGGPGAPGQVAPVARFLSGRFRILEPLQRLSGDVPLTVARHVRDLHEVLEGPVQEGPVRLVGFSWGAMLALTYAARYPDEIDRVILIGCGTFDRHARQLYQDSMEKRMDTHDRHRIDELETLLAYEEDPVRRNELFAQFGEIYTRIQSCNPLPVSTEVLVHDEAGFRQTWMDALSLQEQGLQPEEFKAINAHVTMIHGDEDPHPGELIYDSLVPFIPDIAYREVPRCGHIPWMEREAREVFYQLLLECLE